MSWGIKCLHHITSKGTLAVFPLVLPKKIPRGPPP
ncbi:hypothetical protein EBI_25598 [Enterocytozoon bieneusi H348]|nr:hypothetical protein EBI_25598 [Enterocytozoon bieneusi H348]|eukprot:XP_002651434.1 hypothetical protein EBI_25598 [Enterocytozoon bieneusi H348]